MKTINKIKHLSVIALLTIAFSSCEGWMSVTPHGSMDEDTAFATRRSTQNALNGLYIQLRSNNLYGRALGCEMLELFALHYNAPTSHYYQHYATHNYGDGDAIYGNLKGKLSNVWASAYSTIAYTNEFLAQIEKRKAKYTPAEYNIYRGEALAIRTLLHFDMLRLFGPIYSENKADQAIPYSDVSSNTPAVILSAEEVMGKLMPDIEEAIGLLQNDDILEMGVQERLSNELVNFFTDYRSFRMNLYAAMFLKARMAMYMGDKPTAHSTATSMLTGEMSENFLGTFGFRVFTPGIVLDENVFYVEQIFCNHNARRDEIQTALFSTDLSDTRILQGTEKFVQYMYSDPTAPGGIDPGIRGEIWRASRRSGFMDLQRYTVGSNLNVNHPHRAEIQSMMRIGELYLIAAETAPDTETKRFFIEVLRENRGYQPGNASGMDQAALNNLIDHEFAKETYGDGQYFFFAKYRFKTKLLTQSVTDYTMTKSKYIPDLPDGETDHRYDTETEGELITD